MPMKKFLLAIAAVSISLLGLNSAATNSSATLTADNAFSLYTGNASGSNLRFVGSGNNWPNAWSFNFNVNPGDYLYVMAQDFGPPHAWQGVFTTPAGTIYSDDTNWVATTTNSTTVDQAVISGATWGAIGAVVPANSGPWGNVVGDPNANWIWNSDFYSGDWVVLFRTAAPVAASGGASQIFNTGFNLSGNSSDGTLDVTALFGDAAKVDTVWKWVASNQTWGFYSPTLADGGAAYAASKGYDFLTSINAGEGYWVNAKVPFTAQLPAGTPVSSASLQSIPFGWNLIAVGDNPTPSAFNVAIGNAMNTLWAWNGAQNNWYFYAPSLAQSGALQSYIQSKGYLDFGAGTLAPAMGFWVNAP